MSISSTPLVRAFSRENAESLIQRKPGIILSKSRQPFGDKPVNINKSPAAKVHLKESLGDELTFCEELKSPGTPDLNQYLDVCSYKDMEMFDDNFAYVSCTRRLNKEDIIPIMKNFYGFGLETPPPSPLKEPNFPMPQFIMDDFSFFDTPEMSFEFPEEEHVDEPKMPFNLYREECGSVHFGE